MPWRPRSRAWTRRAQAMGDAFPVAGEQRARSRAELEKVFGGERAAGVFAAPLGEWSGPLRTPYGLHFVRVTAREPARAARLEEVRGQVERALRAERRTLASARLPAEVARRYDVRVEER